MIDRADRAPRDQAGDPALIDVCSFDQAALIEELHAWLSGEAEQPYQQPPAGVVKLAWRQLRNGAPAAFYAFDGDSWHVIVLVHTPDGRYQRLRLRPRSERGLRLAQELYATAEAAEAAALLEGVSSSKVSEIGAERVLAVLGGAGAPGPAAFTELVLRLEAPPTIVTRPQLPAHSFGRLIRLLTGLDTLTAITAGPSETITDLVNAGSELAVAAEECNQLRASVASLGQAAVLGADRFADSAPVLANTGQALAKVALLADEQMAHACDSVQHSLARVHALISWLSLGRIAEEELSRHVLALVDGFVAPGLDEDLERLWNLLQCITIEMAVAVNDLSAALNQTATDIAGGIDDLAAFHRWLGRYRLLVTRSGLWSELHELKEALDEQLVGVAGLERLRMAEEVCRALVVEVDLEALADTLAQTRELLAEADAWPSGTTIR